MRHGKQLAFQISRRVLQIGTPVTSRQSEVLSTIKRLTSKLGMPPTLRELMEELAIASPNGMMSHLGPLKRKGLVTWERYRSRTLRVVEAKGIEVLGSVT